MKTRIIAAAVLLPIFLAILLIFPPIILTIVVSVICGIAAYELLHAAGISRNKSVLVFTIIAAALIPPAVYLSFIPSQDPGNPYSAMLLITLLSSILFIFISLLVIEAVLTMKNTKAIEKGTQLKFRQIPIALAAGMLIPYMLSSIVSLKSMHNGHLLVLLPVVATIITDSGAYFTGVTIGKKKAFPTISPNKTVEGYIGGTIAGIVGMLIYGVILSYTTALTVIFPVLILYGILGAIMTELGDLVFSLIKRKCGIKDYGNLIPGHGGALDRFDSMIFCGPTIYLLVIFIPAFVI
jgi:phosphatidate cytidylyltransferase